jgi:putative transposase
VERFLREGGLAAVGHTVKMLAEGKFIGIPVKQESPHL